MVNFNGITLDFRLNTGGWSSDSGRFIARRDYYRHGDQRRDDQLYVCRTRLVEAPVGNNISL